MVFFFTKMGRSKAQKICREKYLAMPMTAPRLTWDISLNVNGIIPEKTLNCSFDLVGMLLTKQVDAVYGAYFTIEGEQLKNRGFPLGIFTLSQLGISPHYELVIAGNAPNLPFANALQEAIDFCVAHPDEAFALYAKEFAEKSEETLFWEKKSWDKTVNLLAKDQTIDLSLVNTLKEWFLAHGKESLPHIQQPPTLAQSSTP